MNKRRWKTKADTACGLVFPTSGGNPKLDLLDCLKVCAERAKLYKEDVVANRSADWSCLGLRLIRWSDGVNGVLSGLRKADVDGGARFNFFSQTNSNPHADLSRALGKPMPLFLANAPTLPSLVMPFETQLAMAVLIAQKGIQCPSGWRSWWGC